jgi:hypothetical protein
MGNTLKSDRKISLQHYPKLEHVSRVSVNISMTVVEQRQAGEVVVGGRSDEIVID